MWELVEGNNGEDLQTWERVLDDEEEKVTRPQCDTPPVERACGEVRKPLSVHSKEGREVKAALLKLSISDLQSRLGRLGLRCEGITAKEPLAERLLEALGVRDAAAELQLAFAEASPAVPHAVAAAQRALGKAKAGVDYSRFNKIDYASEYGVADVGDDELGGETAPALADLIGTPFEGLDPTRVLRGDLTEEERQAVFLKAMQGIEKNGGLKAPAALPPPECHPVVTCEPPPCGVDACADAWLGSDSAWAELGPGPGDAEQESDVETWPQIVGLGPAFGCEAGVAPAEDAAANVEGTWPCGSDAPACSTEVWEVVNDEEEAHEVGIAESSDTDDHEHLEVEEESVRERERRRIGEAYLAEKSRVQQEARVLEAVDVDGWAVESTQLDLIEASEEDLAELRVLLACSIYEENRQKLTKAIQEFELKLRERRTWGWFPLTRYTWSGYEYQKPVIAIVFKVPGAGKLPPEDIHCEFGTDWFDLKVWNVEWPEDPGVKYHHRVKKTRLMRDIVPEQCSVRASGDRVSVRLQKVSDPRHGYCAWPDLCAGKGRKPFKYQGDKPDGGLMEFFEGEYEKYEGYDGFRRDIGKAMEKIHRCEPIRGIPDTPMDDEE